jgi:hypothetical protein
MTRKTRIARITEAEYERIKAERWSLDYDLIAEQYHALPTNDDGTRKRHGTVKALLEYWQAEALRFTGKAPKVKSMNDILRRHL